ncbi:MAG: helix-turn-helix transcriptional regulator [Actinobacteria bacterium]|nr:helix-turn-helix transcriptional regulator [Actinomycetota bacterium]
MSKITVKNYLAPLIGMVFFWTYFRFQTVFGALYPLETVTHIFGVTVQANAVFLAVLLVLSIVVLLFSRIFENTFSSHRLAVPVLTGLGSLGAVMCVLVQRGLLGSWMLWFSTIFVAIGFLTSYLAWACYFSRSFGSKELILLAVSYLISLVFFTWMGTYLHVSKDYILVSIPICIGLAWYFAKEPKSQTHGESLNSLRKVGPYIGLFIVFLLAGSLIRGMVDIGDVVAGGLQLRWIVSIAVSVLILLASILYDKGLFFAKTDEGRGSEDEFQETERMTLKCWIALALLFFTGTFMCLVSGTYVIGGHIVVVARSALDFLLWVLLCNLASHKNISRVPLFIIYGVLVEVLSLFLSYVLIPHLLSFDTGASMPFSDVLVLAIVFMLIALVVVIFGMITLRKQPAQIVTVPEHIRTVTLTVPEEKAQEYKLTNREVEVIELFSQGYSLNVVASKLFISKSTAQTHAKSIYRKLGIHTKDELIKVINDWTQGKCSDTEGTGIDPST